MSGPSRAGLQAERTGLAWSRTSMGVGANAVLLAVREIGHASFALAAVPAAFALAVAAATALHGRRRSATLRHTPLPRPLASSRAVPLLGWSVVVLGVLTGVVLVLG